MQSKATTVEEYLEQLPDERKQVMHKMVAVIRENLPKGFSEVMGYGMPCWVVPHSIYPNGYHCDPKQPLPFLSLASQKNHITLYHMGIYGGMLLDWFLEEWKSTSTKKPDLGKGCIRFRKEEDIPFSLIGKLVSKITTEEWIKQYEAMLKK